MLPSFKTELLPYGGLLICILAAESMCAHLYMLLKRCHFHLHLVHSHDLPSSVLLLSLATIPAKAYQLKQLNRTKNKHLADE